MPLIVARSPARGQRPRVTTSTSRPRSARRRVFMAQGLAALLTRSPLRVPSPPGPFRMTRLRFTPEPPLSTLPDQTFACALARSNRPQRLSFIRSDPLVSDWILLLETFEPRLWLPNSASAHRLLLTSSFNRRSPDAGGDFSRERPQRKVVSENKFSQLSIFLQKFPTGRSELSVNEL
jgi:hypothetical protein